jgi:hypothetical protein
MTDCGLSKAELTKLQDNFLNEVKPTNGRWLIQDSTNEVQKSKVNQEVTFAILNFADTNLFCGH